MSTYEELISQANAIRTETVEGANTAERVGTHLAQAVEYTKDENLLQDARIVTGVEYTPTSLKFQNAAGENVFSVEGASGTSSDGNPGRIGLLTPADKTKLNGLADTYATKAEVNEKLTGYYDKTQVDGKVAVVDLDLKANYLKKRAASSTYVSYTVLDTIISDLGRFENVPSLEQRLVEAPQDALPQIFIGMGASKGAICLSVPAAVGQYGGWTQLILLDTVLRARKVYKDANGNRTADAWSPVS